MARERNIYLVVNHRLFRPLLGSRFGALAVHWVFQGLLYMDRTERWFKLGIDVVLTLIISVPLALLTPVPLVASVAIAFPLAHTMNWIFNGHIYVVLKHFGKVEHSELEWETYINGLSERAARQTSVHWMAAFGSLARGEFSPTSDLDVRIIRKQGLPNGVRACWFAMLERSRAFFSHYPLDIYVLDTGRPLAKLLLDEQPVTLYDATAGPSRWPHGEK